MPGENDAETVRVVVRCRPMNKREHELKCVKITSMSGCLVSLRNPNDPNCPAKQFTFDAIYDDNSITENVYNDICYPLIESVLEGYNATVFAYGQTGCGKSFTMEGPPRSLVVPQELGEIPQMPPSGGIDRAISTPTDVQKGIIPRSFDHIFEAISVSSNVKYLALVSYLEIYNEQIRDLLVSTNKLTSSNLTLKEIPNQGVVIQGLSTHPVHNVKECEDLLKLGSKNRIIGATLMNQNSSRSHSIFTITLEQIHKQDNQDGTDNHIRKGKLNLVDLAGSERQSKTGASGDRLKEATKINLSLSALGNVISALVDGKSQHIPYRDSKLTRLLQDSLGGNTKTLMIACISPADNNYDETLSTLRYANRAKNICNKPVINEDPKDAMLRKYQEEIQKLRELLQSSKSSPNDLTLRSNFDTFDDNNNDHHFGDAEMKLAEERNKIISQYESQVTLLKSEHENEKLEKQGLLEEMARLRREYQDNMDKVNLKILESEKENARKKVVSKEDILKRLDTIKQSLIGGEKANDERLKEKRKRKKLAAEKRLNALAQVLVRVEQEEDREILQDQYKDIAQALSIKTEGLKKYKHKVKALERENKDIQSEFQAERGDYLETIRRHEASILLYQQIIEKILPQMKRESNYSNVDTIKEQAVWNDELQKWKIPEVVYNRTKLPPAAKSRSSCSSGSSSTPSSPDYRTNSLGDKLERSVENDICGSYFKPRRATQLLQSQSTVSDDDSYPIAENGVRAFHHWKDMALKSKEHMDDNVRKSPSYNQAWNNIGVNANEFIVQNVTSPPDPDFRIGRPIKLQSLPSLEIRKNRQLNKMDVI